MIKDCKVLIFDVNNASKPNKFYKSKIYNP